MTGAQSPQHFSTTRPGASMQRPLMGQQAPQLGLSQMGSFQGSNPYWQPPAIPAPAVNKAALQHSPVVSPQQSIEDQAKALLEQWNASYQPIASTSN